MQRADFERAFASAVDDLCRRSIAAKYRPTRVQAMVAKHGALAATRLLLARPVPPDGLLAMARMGRVDLTLEALVLQEPWRELFEPEILANAERTVRQLFGASAVPSRSQPETSGRTPPPRR